MKDIRARMEGEELEEYRRVERHVQVLQSGAVEMSFADAEDIVERHREFWTRMHEKYELDPDEFHVFDAVTGTISVDKSE